MNNLNLDDSFIEQEYIKGESTYKIAKELGCSPDTISNHLKDMGHKLRGNRIYNFNESFFEEIDTFEKAWMLGWIYSDGHVKKNEIKIKLKREDSYILNNFVNLLNYDPVLTIKADNSISICSKKMVKDLNNLGIPCGKKSRIIKPPKLLNELLSAFWQGVFEGDGSISYTKDGYFDIALTGNYNTCQMFSNYIGWSNKIYKNGLSYVSRKVFSSIDKNTFHKIYNRELIKKDLYLKRKYELFGYAILRHNIMEKIKPTKDEKKKLFYIYKNIKDNFIKSGFNSIELCGSTQKDTFLSGGSDLDIFVKFPKSFPKENFKTEIIPRFINILIKMGVQINLQYASHPYLHGVLDNVNIDVVPCYDIQNTVDIISAVDRTPFHTKYVKKNLKRGQKDEVRLLKQFLKAHDLYGANEKYQGFSGYLAELLIIEYGNFIEVLKNELKNHRQDDPHTPIVLLDPTDYNRNVAAALSWQKFNEFVLVSRQFLRDYETESDKRLLNVWFDIYEEDPFDKEDVKWFTKCNGTTAYWIEYKNISNNEEVIYSIVRKNLKKIVKMVEQYGFKVYHSAFKVEGDKSIFIIEVEHNQIPYVKMIKGPNIDVPKKAFYNWIEKHGSPNIFIRDKDFYAKIMREYNDLNNLLQDKLKTALSIERLIYD